MDISFLSNKFRKECNDYRLLVGAFGERQAKVIRRRLDELHAATTLAEVSTLPPARCHELVGDRAGQLSVDLVFPYRLVFLPANDPIPTRPDGGLDWARVTAIRITGVEDTHDKKNRR